MQSQLDEAICGEVRRICPHDRHVGNSVPANGKETSLDSIGSRGNDRRSEICSGGVAGISKHLEGLAMSKSDRRIDIEEISV